MDTFDALNECQDHLLASPWPTSSGSSWSASRRSSASSRTRPCGRRWSASPTLWALWRIEQDRGWFLENGYLEGGKAKAIRALVNRLLAEVRPDALALVDAFGIPDNCLAAPIAFAQAPDL